MIALNRNERTLWMKCVDSKPIVFSGANNNKKSYLSYYNSFESINLFDGMAEADSSDQFMFSFAKTRSKDQPSSSFGGMKPS